MPPAPARGLWGRIKHALREPATGLALCGGACGALSYDPLGLRPLILLAPLLLWLAARQMPTPGAALRRVLLGAWVFYFGTLHWLCTLSEFNPLAPLGIALLALYIAFYPALAAWITRRWFRLLPHATQFLVFAGLWLLGEWVRTLGRLAVPLAQLGHAWAPLPGLIQIARWLGELGVSAQVLLLAWGLLLLGDAAVHRAGRPALLILRRAAFFLLLIGVGLINRLPLMADAPPCTPLKVALLQPNIDQMTKLASYAYPDAAVQARLQQQMAQLQETMLSAHQPNDWDLLVLPESSFTEADFSTNAPVRERVARMAVAAGCDMVVGGNRDASTSTTEEVYNSAWVVRADGSWAAQAYDKMRLVPFGECLPYFDVIPGFQENVVGIGSFTEGRAPVLFDATGRAGRIAAAGGPLHYGILICFESTFSTMARRLAREGADFIVVQTNDAWYGASAGAAQHHHLSRLRAVESGRPVIRCANTGISSVIDAHGNLVASLPLLERGVLESEVCVPRNPPPTLFARLGNAWLALVGAGLLAAWFAARRAGKIARFAMEK